MGEPPFWIRCCRCRGHGDQSQTLDQCPSTETNNLLPRSRTRVCLSLSLSLSLSHTHTNIYIATLSHHHSQLCAISLSLSLSLSRLVPANTSLQTVFSIERNQTDIRSLEHVVVQLSLAIENYTTARSLAQYHIMQSLLGTHFDQSDINSILQHSGAKRGGIEISIVSPSGTESLLLPRRERDFVNTGSLSWSFMSVLHWGEDPTGEWQLAVGFTSTEGRVRVSGLNVTLYGISQTSLESVSDNCSSVCRGRCSGYGASYCDKCLGYRDSQNLECSTHCNLTTHEVQGRYCIPRPAHSTTASTNHLSTTSTVVVSSQTKESRHSFVIPSRTKAAHVESASILEELDPRKHTYAISHSFSSMLKLHHSESIDVDTTASHAGHTPHRYDVMMTSPLLQPTPVNVRTLTTSHALAPTNAATIERDMLTSDHAICAATSVVCPCVNCFLVTCLLLLTVYYF